tara:strand:+ start:20732 stop:21103 length:372 start_codon:yes stop_codon:yes gene_type:complete
MAKINIQGVGVSVTETMRTEAQKAISKVFNRYPPISHRLTVRESPKGIELKLSYQDDVDSYEASHTCKDFYGGIKVIRDTMLRNIKRTHQSKIDQKRKGGIKNELARDSIDDDESELMDEEAL